MGRPGARPRLKDQRVGGWGATQMWGAGGPLLHESEARRLSDIGKKGEKSEPPGAVCSCALDASV